MKIRCQEHYDKVAEYAKSIGDTTFQNCIGRLKQWEKNSNGRYEIEFYWDFAPYSFGFAERTPDVLCRDDWRSVPRMEHTYVKNSTPQVNP